MKHGILEVAFSNLNSNTPYIHILLQVLISVPAYYNESLAALTQGLGVDPKDGTHAIPIPIVTLTHGVFFAVSIKIERNTAVLRGYDMYGQLLRHRNPRIQALACHLLSVCSRNNLLLYTNLFNSHLITAVA